MSDQKDPIQDQENDELEEKLKKLKDEKREEETKLKQAINNEETNNLQAQLKEKNKEIERLTEISKRSIAELENFRRRTEEEKKAFASFANANLITDLLPVLDNFKRAIDHLHENLKNDEWTTGIHNIEKQFISALERQGLKEIEALNKDFDPNFHEGLLQVPGEKDKVMQILEPGYILGEKILRPTKVGVGNGEECGP